MNEIIIQVFANRKLSKKTVDIGNMQENKVTKLKFELDEDIVALGGNVYLFVSYDGESYPYPLTDNAFEVGRELTQRKKTEANIVVSTSDDPENLLEHAVWISNTLMLMVDKNSINIDAINEVKLPPSLQIVYDRLFALEKDLQEKKDIDYWRGPKGDKGDKGDKGEQGDAGVDEETFLKLAIKPTTEQAEFLHITDSAEYRILNFSMDGKTEQYTGVIQDNEGNDVDVPSPYYPQEIVKAGKYNDATGRYEHKVRIFSRNIVSSDPNDWYRATDGTLRCDLIMPEDVEVVTVTVRTKDEINYPIGKLGTASPNTQYISWLFSDELDFYHSSETCNNGKTICANSKFTLEEIFENYEIQVQYGSQIKQDDIYPYQNILVFTSPVPISKWDYLTKRDGVWGWSINCKEHIVTGDEEYKTIGNCFTGASTNMGLVVDDIINSFIKMEDTVYCSDLKAVNGIWMMPNGSIGLCNYNNAIQMRFPNTLLGVSDNATVAEKTDAYKAYLKQRYTDGNPVTLLYETSKEQAFIPLLEEEQVFPNNMETYYGVTSAYNDQGCPMQLQYVADTKNYIDNQLLEIKKAMI